MKKIRRSCCALLALLGCSRDTPIPPKPRHWVTDRAAFLMPAVKIAVDAQLKAYQERTGNHVLVWIDHALPPKVSLEVYSLLLFNSWGIGKWNSDNGVVLFVFADDHKARIQVGYGLEAKLPDRECNRIGFEVIRPQLKDGAPNAAIVNGVTAILAALGEQ